MSECRWKIVGKEFKDDKTGRYKIPCLCICGTQKNVNKTSLTTGTSLSCGCLRQERSVNSRLLNLKEQRFGKLTAKYPVHHKGRLSWYCVCDCGGSTTVMTSNLTTGNTKSCSCTKGDSLRTHGRWGHPCYTSWGCMRQRCNNPHSSDYQNYGGRGITICHEWSDIEVFIKDMGSPPSEKHTLDRKDTNGNYCKSNCRWATVTTQMNNRRNTIYINKVPLMVVSRKYNVPKGTLYSWKYKGLSDNEIMRRVVENLK